MPRTVVFVGMQRKFTLDETLLNAIAAYVDIGIAERDFRKTYLRMMLLGPPTIWNKTHGFRLFTYFSNGLAGHTSEREDIIDRVLAFVV